MACNKNKNLSQNEVCITIIGPRGSGKTCFLASLAYISNDVNRSTLNLNPSDKPTRDYFNTLNETVKSKIWPHATSTWNTLCFELTIKNKTESYRVVDYVGEDLQKQTHEGIPYNEEFLKNLYSSEIILFLIDSSEADSLTTKTLQRLQQCLQVLSNAYKESEKLASKECANLLQKPNHRNLYIVLTKADKAERVFKALGKENRIKKVILKQLGDYDLNLKNAASKIPNLSPDFRYFGFSLFSQMEQSDVSEQDDSKMPADINPSGLNAILEAIGTERERTRCKKFKDLIWKFVVAIILCSFIGLGFLFYYDCKANDTIISIHATLAEIVDSHPIFKWTKQKRLKEIENRCEEIRERIQSASVPDTLDDEINRLKDLEPNDQIIKSRIDELIKAGNDKKEELESKVINSAPDDIAVLGQIRQFQQKYPGSKYNGEVDKKKDRILSNSFAKLINEIIDTKVINTSSLQTKVRLINDLLTNTEYTNRITNTKIEEIKKGKETADKFLSKSDRTVTVTNYGYFADKSFGNDVKLEIWKNGELKDGEVRKGELLYKHEPEGDITDVSPNESFDINANIGDKILIVLYADTTILNGQRPVAQKTTINIADLFGILDLGSTSEGQGYCGYKGYYVKAKLADFEENDIRAFKEYILPGQGWIDIDK